MRALQIDAGTGGFVVVNGRPQFIEKKDAKAQQVRIRLQTIQGEYFLDRSLGIPYFSAILVKNPNLQYIQFLYQKALTDLQLTNITISGSFDKVTRRFILAWQATDPDTNDTIAGAT